MAQFLYDRHSTNIHLNIVKRHIRLFPAISAPSKDGNGEETPVASG